MGLDLYLGGNADAIIQIRFLFMLMERVALNVQPEDATIQLNTTLLC